MLGDVVIVRSLDVRGYGCEIRWREGCACVGGGWPMRLDGNLVGDLSRGVIERDRMKLVSWE